MSGQEVYDDDYKKPEIILALHHDEARSIESFAAHVIHVMNLDGWRMEWEMIDPCGWCMTEVKKFTIPPWILHKEECFRKEYVLHEISHGASKENEHSPAFYQTYIKLLQRFMAGIKCVGQAESERDELKAENEKLRERVAELKAVIELRHE